jgi:hypothetical protein
MPLVFKCKVLLHLFYFLYDSIPWCISQPNIILNSQIFLSAIPEDAINEDSDEEDKSNPDERISIRASDKRIAPDNEYSDSEDEGDSRRDQRSKYKILFC